MTLTSIVLTENDFQWLVKCISQLRFASEIIISDTGTDYSLKEKVQNVFPEANILYYYDSDIDPRVRYFKYAKLAQSDYVHWIHPDEIYSPELAEAISYYLRNSHDIFDALAVRPTDILFGTDFGKANNYTVRIFKKGLFQLANNSNVHSEIFLRRTSDTTTYNGMRVKFLDGDYIHYSNPYLLIILVKLFRYEMINAKALTNLQLSRTSIDKNGVSFFRVLKLMAKINVRFFRTFKSQRKFGYGGLALAIASALRVIAEEIAPTEELLFRESKIDFNDTRGYINMKRDPYDSTTN